MKLAKGALENPLLPKLLQADESWRAMFCSGDAMALLAKIKTNATDESIAVRV